MAKKDESRHGRNLYNPKAKLDTSQVQKKAGKPRPKPQFIAPPTTIKAKPKRKKK